MSESVKSNRMVVEKQQLISTGSKRNFSTAVMAVKEEKNVAKKEAKYRKRSEAISGVDAVSPTKMKSGYERQVDLFKQRQQEENN